ncbi:MAG: DUF2220 domain-containing protein, partial [Ruminococcus sp.]|nr:DUF2220 domain-containing protein [Ruminococcus sp.]
YILNYLLDKYEKSRMFIENNGINRKISVKIKKLFPEYEDEAEYQLFIEVNEAVHILESENFIIVSEKNNGLINSITLNTDKLNDIYTYILRKPKSETNQQLLSLLESYNGKNEILTLFCKTQIEKINRNKKVELFSGDFKEYSDILKAVSELFKLQEETYTRDFSVHMFGDSKRFEKIKSKVISLLYHYGDFPQEENILEELNLIRNPGHIYIKGACRISVSGQIIDFSALNADIAVSSVLINSIDSIEVTGNKVITIENLTTFNRFCEENAMIIYLGGYHNTHRRNFIRKLYVQNPDISYYHYGDIDAGGFYILLHLRKKTDIKFIPYHMDIDTLQKYSDMTKPLTDNDRKRLQNITDIEFSEVIRYMLENNCKLEQEAI